MSDSGFVLPKNQGGIIVAPVIHILPVEGWGYFVKNKDRLSKELVEIASNEDTNTSVYMTEEDGSPYLYVYRDDKKIFQSECTTVFETERNLRVVYAQYLTPVRIVVEETELEEESDISGYSDVETPAPDDNDVPPCKGLDEMTEDEFQEYVSEREDAIFAAVTALIEVLTEDDIGNLSIAKEDDSKLDNIVDHIVEHLAINCGLCIRRPMTVIEDESGLHVRTEYPYEEFDFSAEELH